jgi:predicted phage tail protein
MTYMSGGTASPLAAGLMTSGIGMMAGGVIQMLSPQPAGLASKQDADNKPSYAFGSVTNTAAQGIRCHSLWKASYRWCNYFRRNLR